MSTERHALGRGGSVWRHDLASALAWLVVALVLAILAALFVAANIRRGWLFLAAIAAAYVLSLLSAQMRHWGLFAAVLASALLTGSGGSIPYGLTLTQALLVFVLVAEVLAAADARERPLARSVAGGRFYVAFVAFAALGLVSTRLNGEILTYWPTVCLTPLLLLFLADRLIDDPDSAFALVKAAVLAAVLFLGIVWFAQVTGHSYFMTQYGSGFAGRFADARQVVLGPLSFQVWAIRVGSLAALGMPVVLVLALGGGRRLERWLALAGIVVFVVVLGFTAARGAMIGAALGGVVAIVMSRRLNLSRTLFYVLVGAMALAVTGPLLLRLFPQAGIQRILELGSGLGSIRNFVYRINVWDVTFRGLGEHPLGPGFGYLYTNYGLDEAVGYTMILNGTGVLGFVAFILMTVQMARRYVGALWSRVPDARRDLAAIGTGTLVGALLSAVSSQSVFVEPVQTIVFWSIEIGAVLGIALSASGSASTSVAPGEANSAAGPGAAGTESNDDAGADDGRWFDRSGGRAPTRTGARGDG